MAPDRGSKSMQADIEEKRDALADLCRRYGVARLEVFGSAARDTDFDRRRSDVDFLVTFAPDARNDLIAFLDLKDALETLLGRSVDLVERDAIEASRNYIRRRAILRDVRDDLWLNCRNEMRRFSLTPMLFSRRVDWARCRGGFETRPYRYGCKSQMRSRSANYPHQSIIGIASPTSMPSRVRRQRRASASTPAARAKSHAWP
jgi:predicted nucleotidyltransferase